MSFSRESVGNYFLEKECPFAKKRTIDVKKVAWVSIAVVSLGLVVLLSFPTQRTLGAEAVLFGFKIPRYRDADEVFLLDPLRQKQIALAFLAFGRATALR